MRLVKIIALIVFGPPVALIALVISLPIFWVMWELEGPDE